MKNDKEIVGTLQGFDDFVNMLLEDVTESEATPEGRRVTKLDQILLNGSNITMVFYFMISKVKNLNVEVTNYIISITHTHIVKQDKTHCYNLFLNLFLHSIAVGTWW